MFIMFIKMFFTYCFIFFFTTNFFKFTFVLIMCFFICIKHFVSSSHNEHNAVKDNILYEYGINDTTLLNGCPKISPFNPITITFLFNFIKFNTNGNKSSKNVLHQ